MTHRSAGCLQRSYKKKPRRPGSASHEHLRPRPSTKPRVRGLEHITDTCPGYNLGKAYKRVTREFEKEFRSSDLTLAQFALLVNIGRDEPASGSDVALRLGSDLSTVSRTIELLVTRGFVAQERGEDRRVRLYRLTAEGRAALAEAIPKWRRARYQVLSRLDHRSWRRTLRQLRALAS